MSPATAFRIEAAIIGLGILALVMIFQPFSLLIFSIGCGLVVLAALVNNLLPFAQPGKPLRKVIFAGGDRGAGVLRRARRLDRRGAISTASPSSIRRPLARRSSRRRAPFWVQPLVWTLAAIAIVLGLRRPSDDAAADAMPHDVSVIGLYILDVLGRPVSAIPEGGDVEFIDEIRLTVAGTAGGTVVDAAKLGLDCLAVGAVGDDEKADFVLATLDGFGVDTAMMARVPGRPDLGHDPQRPPERRAPGAARARRLGPFRHRPRRLRPGVRRADRPSRRHRSPAPARRPARRPRSSPRPRRGAAPPPGT